MTTSFDALFSKLAPEAQAAALARFAEHVAQLQTAPSNAVGLPATRAEAIKVGAPRYFTGVPCKHGHLESRYTSTMVCLGCQAMRARDLRNLVKQRAAAWAATPEGIRAEAQFAEWKALLESKELKRYDAHLDMTSPAAPAFMEAVPRMLRARYPHLTDGRIPIGAPPREGGRLGPWTKVSYVAHKDDRDGTLARLATATTNAPAPAAPPRPGEPYAVPGTSQGMTGRS